MSEPSAAPAPAGLGLLDKLGSLFRSYAVPAGALVLSPPFVQDDRNCFTVPVPPEWESDERGSSAVRLLEDGQPLGPAHVGHDDVRTLGRGRYSHWGPKIYFSSSDNSDPNGNGRVYAVLPPHVAGEHDERARAAEAAGGVRLEWSVTEVEPSAVLAVAGHAYALAVPAAWPSDRDSTSTLMLLEDGRPLPLPHAAHDEIARLGGGRYSHWADELRFSASDGSDPRSNGRRYAVARADAFLFRHAPRPPVPEQGHCFVLPDLPAEWTGDDAGRSRLVLLEDGRPLGPAHASHDQIRQQGSGRYCHWGRQLWFSTSDNTDPLHNGRSYAVVWRAEDDAAG